MIRPGVPEEVLMPATAMVVDFSNDETLEDPLPLTGTRVPARIGSKGGVIGRPITSKEKKQIRQRARRKLRNLSEDEQEALWGKDISQWDLEELAKGRPRADDGSFRGKAPGFLSRQLHEEIIRRFEEIVRQEMNGYTVDALTMLHTVLGDNTTDVKGRRNTPRSVQVDVAKFLIEHVIGKPKQRTEADISVKLQGILGMAIANPTMIDGQVTTQYQLPSSYIDVPSWEAEEEDEAE
jgi:hypothetical protein